MKNNYPFTDDELCLAAELSCKAAISETKTYGQANVAFSESFISRMDLLTRRVKRRERLKLAFLRIAAILLVSIIVSITWLAADAEAREMLFNWVRSYTQNEIQYRFENNGADNGPEISARRYAPAWLPQGIELREIDDLGDMVLMTFEDEAADSGFLFEYDFVEDSVVTGIFDSSLSAEKLSINGMDAELVTGSEPSGSINLTWLDAENGIVFSINGNLSKEEIIRIAESVKLSEEYQN